MLASNDAFGLSQSSCLKVQVEKILSRNFPMVITFALVQITKVKQLGWNVVIQEKGGEKFM
jgi:hypothetical protein